MGSRIWPAIVVVKVSPFGSKRVSQEHLFWRADRNVCMISWHMQTSKWKCKCKWKCICICISIWKEQEYVFFAHTYTNIWQTCHALLSHSVVYKSFMLVAASSSIHLSPFPPSLLKKYWHKCLTRSSESLALKIQWLIFINRLVQFVHQQYEQKLLRSQVVCFILLETFQFASICQFNQRMNSFKRFTKKPARLSFLPENLPICDKKSNSPFASSFDQKVSSLLVSLLCTNSMPYLSVSCP